MGSVKWMEHSRPNIDGSLVIYECVHSYVKVNLAPICGYVAIKDFSDLNFNTRRILKNDNFYQIVTYKQVMVSDRLNYDWVRFGKKKSEFILKNFSHLFSSTVKEKIISRNKKLGKI